jgi:hypothetical protein
MSKRGRAPTKKSDNYKEIGQLVDHAQNWSKLVVSLPKVSCVKKEHEEFQNEKNFLGQSKTVSFSKSHLLCRAEGEKVLLLYICGVGSLNVLQTLCRARS